jgi:predicted DNA binding protein
MSNQIFRFLQLKVTIEQAKGAPGLVMTNFFQKMEIVSPMSWSGEIPEYLVNLELNEDLELENFTIPGILEVIKVISNFDKNALVIARFHGPVLMLIHQIDECWIQTPSILSDINGLFLTVHGTTGGLKKFRDGIKNLLPDTVKVRITKNLKADWIAAPKLPQRRKEVIDLAVKRGYYKTPRKCTQRELADELGVRQGTVAEHLQSAEGMIIESWSEQANK